jgi:diadenosine tetraphosphate (Ap4A) HIT family hydrolase
MSGTWPGNWDRLLDGSECPMCRHGVRVESDRYGVRFYAGKYADAYLQRADVQRGYTLVIWHGPHVTEPVDLADEEAAGYWLDVLNAARGLIEHFKPLKMNYETLGNGTPHLHTHLVPRYWDDPAAGQPFPLNAGEPPEELVEPDQLDADVAALQALVHYEG